MNPYEELDAPALPSAEALVAGTVALMTTWADPCPHCTLPLAVQRALMARKIAANLDMLQHHPALSAGLQQVMARARPRWAGLAGAADPVAGEPASDVPAPGPTPAAMALY